MALAVARAEVVTTVDKVGRMRSKISLHFIVMAINSQHNQDNHQATGRADVKREEMTGAEVEEGTTAAGFHPRLDS